MLFPLNQIFITFFMIHWIPYAFVRIVLFFLGGIFMGIYYPDILPENYCNVIFSNSRLPIQSYWLLQLGRRNSFIMLPVLKYYAGAVGLTSLFLAGYLNVLTNTDTRRPDHLVHITSPVEFYKAVIISSPKEKDRSWKVEAALESVRTRNQWVNCKANILLYFSKEDFPTSFQYGDVLLVKGTPQQVSGPGNPEEFDYREILEF